MNQSMTKRITRTGLLLGGDADLAGAAPVYSYPSAGQHVCHRLSGQRLPGAGSVERRAEIRPGRGLCDACLCLAGRDAALFALHISRRGRKLRLCLRRRWAAAVSCGWFSWRGAVQGRRRVRLFLCLVQLCGISRCRTAHDTAGHELASNRDGRSRWRVSLCHCQAPAPSGGAALIPVVLGGTHS